MSTWKRAAPIPVKRNSLSHSEAALYDKLLGHILALEDKIVIEVPKGSIEMKRLPQVYYAVLQDHPEVFWLQAYVSYSISSGWDSDCVGYKLSWGIPKSKYDIARRKVYNEAGRFSAGLPAGASAYARAESAYRYVNQLARYRSGATQNQTILGVILGHEAVCAGFAKTYQFLLSQVGVACGCVEGTIVDGGPHLYNIVQLEGLYAYVDPTWASPGCNEDPNTRGSIRQLTYRYFCLTASEIGRTHIPEKGQWLPPADSHRLDWFLRNGLLFSRFDAKGLDRLVCAAIERGDDSIELKFKNVASFEATVGLIAGSGVLSLRFTHKVQQMGCSWAYVVNDRVRTLQLMWGATV